MDKQKVLNLLQQGILQQILFGVIAVFFFVVMGVVFYYIGKSEFIKTSNAPAIDIVGLAVIFSLIAVVVLRALLRIHLSWKVTLPKAVEFSSAMRKLGFFDFSTQLAFVSAQGMNVFIADKQFLHDMQNDVRARRYIYLGHKDVLSSHSGMRTLCLDAEEYERVVNDVKTPFFILESTILAEKETEIVMLQKELLNKVSELESLSAENTLFKEECAALKARDDTAPGRGKSNDNLHASRAPFWLVAVPLINRLYRDAAIDTVYTKRTIQIEFEKELENYPAFKHMVKDILATQNKIMENTPFSLDGWAMRAICEVLDVYDVKVKRSPGPRPKK